MASQLLISDTKYYPKCHPDGIDGIYSNSYLALVVALPSGYHRALHTYTGWWSYLLLPVSAALDAMRTWPQSSDEELNLTHCHTVTRFLLSR
jgi:hypothetical protein